METILEVHGFSASRVRPTSLSSPIWSVHFRVVAKVAKMPAFQRVCKDPPVPRRLVGLSKISPNMSPAYRDTGSSLPGIRLAGQLGNIGTYKFLLRPPKVNEIL